MRLSNIIFLLLICHISWGQSKRNAKVDLNIVNRPIEDLFTDIEQSTDVKFSFNTALINRDSIVTYHCSNKSTNKVIKELFDNKVLAKKVGRHIVLIENPKEVIVNEPVIKEVILYGTILDARTNKGIKDVSVYDIYSRRTVLTDPKGKFQFTTRLKHSIKTYNIAKNGYNNTVATIDWSTNKYLNVELLSIQEKIDQLDTKEINFISAQEKSKFLFGLVPAHVLITTENLYDISEKKISQVSLLPYIGTNWMSKGVVANNFSFNILVGYNGGVDGVEIGGLVNIIDKNVNGFQLAGLSNIVAGNVKGTQVAGVLNRTKGRTNGFQISGVSNQAYDTIKGFQIAGINNYAGNYINGAQISGIQNIASDSINGLQLAGIKNVGKKHINGAQVAGVLNIASESIKGLQLAGLKNNSKKSIKGAQIAGVINVLSDSISGVQIAGIYNRAEAVTTGIQIAGIKNRSRGENNGFQLALVNKSKKNNGLQLGLVNFSEKGNGIAIGLLNFVKDGYRSFEVLGNEFTHTSAKLKMGSKYFYTLLSFGIRPENPNFRSAGLGVGAMVGLTNRTSITMDVTSSIVQINENKYAYRNLNNRFDLSLDFRLSNRLGIFFGPSYNVFISNVKRDDLTSVKDQLIDYPPLFSSYKTEVLVHQWIGGNVGMRYRF